MQGGSLRDIDVDGAGIPAGALVQQTTDVLIAHPELLQQEIEGIVVMS